MPPFDAETFRQELQTAARIVDPVGRNMEVMAVLSRAFESIGHTRPVLVGGAAVDYYTGGAFGSRDIDALLYTPSKVVDDVMTALGFEKEQGRYWYQAELNLLVEYPGSPDEPHLYGSVMVGDTSVRIERLESAIMTRLCFFAQGSMADGIGALFLVLADRGRIDWGMLHGLAERELVSHLLEGIKEMAAAVNWAEPPSRQVLEEMLFRLKNPTYAPIMEAEEES